MNPPLSPDASAAERVFIVADAARSLNEAWHAGIDGFDDFGPPRTWRVLSRCTLYAADRVDRGAVASHTVTQAG